MTTQNKKCTVFTRTWWKVNTDGQWPNNLEPSMGRKKILRRGLTEEEARKMCDEWNANNNPGKLSRMAEFTDDL